MKETKPSLRKELERLIMEKGYVSLDEITNYAIVKGHKQDTARRILNSDMSPMIETEHNEKNQICGYRYKLFNTIQNAKPVEGEMRFSKLF